MKITFASITTNDNGKNKIKFTSNLKYAENKGLRIFEFIEPENNILNMIEVGEKIVNIFAGPSTINLKLNEKILNEYQTPAGLVYFESFLESIKDKGNLISIKYKLSQKEKEFGNFEINLKIEKSN